MVHLQTLFENKTIKTAISVLSITDSYQQNLYEYALNRLAITNRSNSAGIYYNNYDKVNRRTNIILISILQYIYNNTDQYYNTNTDSTNEDNVMRN